jgi:drug/metabolite transporter (DMT)-like permease
VFTSNALAVGSAICIATGSMFISELKGRVPLLQLARWQLIFAFFLTAMMSLLLGGWKTIGLWQFEYLALSGLFGIAIASTTYYATIYVAGPRITALLFALTSPIALLLGYLFLGEVITRLQGLGIAFVMAGVVLALDVSWATVFKPAVAADHVRHSPWLGISLGLITAAGQAIGTLFARPVMAMGVEPFSAMAVRSGLAAVFFVLLMMVPIGRVKAKKFEAKSLALASSSTFFGMFLGMSLLMAALHGGNVGIVSTLSSMTPVLILPLVWARTGKRPALTAWAGALLAIAGTALISLH